ncbi:hypothetical protein DER45DRAFT_624383 [Fusarium avenaceum]|nr:hypothetical protein DER45DRAFT_624383 [Fusarium avenaceum]
MLSKQLLALSSLLVGCCAQEVPTANSLATNSEPTGKPTESPSPTLRDMTTSTTTTTGYTTHTINVGAAGHKFTPNNIKADVGDIVEYRFYPDGHWVIRGDFDNPCIPYEYVDTDRTGFSSGPQPVKAITNDASAPRFRVRVNDTKPIFFYCGAPGSCVRYHMMGVVNPSKNETLAKWLKNADNVDFQLTPGEPFPTEQGFPTSTKSAISKSTTSAIPESTTSITTGPTSNSTYRPDGNGLSGGVIAGIVIGSVAVLGIIIGVVYLCGRRGGFNAYHQSFGNHAKPGHLSGVPPVTEVEVGSPTSMPGYWVYKPTSPIPSSIGQSHHTSPPLSPLYNFHQDNGIVTPQTESNFNTNYVSNFSDLPPHPPPRPPKELPFEVAELPGQRLEEPAVELPYYSSPIN